MGYDFRMPGRNHPNSFWRNSSITMNLVAKYSNNSELTITVLNLECFGNYAIHNFDKFSYLLNTDIELYNLLGDPVLNNNSLEFYSGHKGLKNLDAFDDANVSRIQSEINSIISHAKSTLGTNAIRDEIINMLSKPCDIFSNGKDHIITWGYYEIKLSKINTQNVESIDLSTYISEASNRRTEVGGEIGNLTISLIWDTTDDLDLYVIEPDGTRVGPGAPESKNGGKLDVDANYDTIISNPMENIYWDTPPKGKYTVYVNCFERRETKKGRPIKFEIEVLMAMNAVQKYSGDIKAGDRKNTHVPIEVLID